MLVLKTNNNKQTPLDSQLKIHTLDPIIEPLNAHATICGHNWQTDLLFMFTHWSCVCWFVGGDSNLYFTYTLTDRLLTSLKEPDIPDKQVIYAD